MRSEQEFTGIVRQYLNMVYRIALNWFGSVQDAEDAAQEVMLRVWKAEAVPSDKDHLRHWLVRVTVNVCKDLSHPLRGLRPVPLSEVPEPFAEQPEDQGVLVEVMALPKKYRVPLYLFHYEGYSVREIAGLLRMNPSTVRSRLARARDLRKKQLDRSDG